MARPGISYQEVARVAIQLTEQNTRPSIEAIRKQLGTGSNSTINRHLREWSKTQGLQTELEQGLPESLLIAIRGIYDAMREQANSQLVCVTKQKKQVTADFTSQVEALEQNIAQLKQDNLNLHTRVNQAQEEHSALQRRLDDFCKEAEKKDADNHLLNERLNDKHSDIEQLTQLLKHTQSNLEHYRETMRQERFNDKQNFEEKVATLESQRQSLQSQALESKETIARLSQHVELLESAQAVAVKAEVAAKESAQNYLSTLQGLEFKLAQLQQAHHQLLSSQQSLIKENESKEIKNHELVIKTETQTERISMFEMALKKSEDSLKNLADKHLFLTQEKTELAFQLQTMLETS